MIMQFLLKVIEIRIGLTQRFSNWGSRPFLGLPNIFKGLPKSFYYLIFLRFIDVSSILGSRKYINILKRVSIQKSLRTPGLTEFRILPEMYVSTLCYNKKELGKLSTFVPDNKTMRANKFSVQEKI